MSEYEYLKSKTWFITMFEDELKHPEDVIYDISCEDSTEKGFFHYHQVLCYENPVSIDVIRELYPTSHIERARSVYDSINYLKNNRNGRKSNVIEIGHPPINTECEKYTTEDLEHIEDPSILSLRLQKIWRELHNKDKESQE